MTTIKIKTKLINFKGCSTCPFIVYTDVFYCGEITGEYLANCGLLDGSLDDNDCKEYDEDGRHEWVRDDRRHNCPIISIDIKEEDES